VLFFTHVVFLLYAIGRRIGQPEYGHAAMFSSFDFDVETYTEMYKKKHKKITQIFNEKESE
jgi:hypothetical protein